jgi:DNA polymerase III epsilon subunit-like protein
VTGMGKLVALDCETTSLRRDCRIWEIAVIVREPGCDEAERRWFIDVMDLDLGQADPFSLDIGGFYQRHPQMNPKAAGEAWPEADVLADVERVCRKAHIIGNVVNFDTQRLDARMAAHGILWNGHYHLVDVEALAVGWLSRSAAELRAAGLRGDDVMEAITPPWKSDVLAGLLGVTITPEARHTALGDARWALDMYDVIMGIA